MGNSEATIFNIQSAIFNLAALPQISLGTAAVLIFGVCLTYILLRGVGRMLVGTAMLTVSALLGLITWQKGPEISMAVFNKSVGFITTGLPIIVFVVSFILIRIALKWIANPFGGEDKAPLKDRRGLSKFRLMALLGFALIPTLIIMLLASGLIHHKASIDELRQRAGQDANAGKTWAQELKASIQTLIPNRLLSAIDPYAEKSRMALAKWVSDKANKKEELEPAIDPETGKVIPRAIIVEDAELERLAREQKFGTLLRHPVITKALEDPEVRKLVDDLDF